MNSFYSLAGPTNYVQEGRLYALIACKFIFTQIEQCLAIILLIILKILLTHLLGYERIILLQWIGS